MPTKEDATARDEDDAEAPEEDDGDDDDDDDPAPPVHEITSSGHHYHRFPGDSRGCDTSSLYSGSDTMHSLQSGQDEVDLSGLHESVVDSDEEDLAESIGSFTLRDAVRDCLEKDPTDRGEKDIEKMVNYAEKFADEDDDLNEGWRGEYGARAAAFQGHQDRAQPGPRPRGL